MHCDIPREVPDHDPLQWIASKNRLDWVKFLFPFVTNLNKTTLFSSNLGLIWDDNDNDSWTALMTASAEGFTEIAKYIFENSDGKDIGKILFMFLLSFVLIFQLSDQAKTAFMLAVIRGEIDVVKLFLEYAEAKKIDLNAIDCQWFDKHTALFYAVLRQQDQILDLLCQDPRIEINVKLLLWLPVISDSQTFCKYFSSMPKAETLI